MWQPHTGIRNTDGKPIKLDPVDGCAKYCEVVMSVPLKPYPNPEKARDALILMCVDFGYGKEKARAALAAGWPSMPVDGLALERQDAKTQFAILANLYGRGRIIDELNRKGTLAFLGETRHVGDARRGAGDCSGNRAGRYSARPGGKFPRVIDKGAGDENDSRRFLLRLAGES